MLSWNWWFYAESDSLDSKDFLSFLYGKFCSSVPQSCPTLCNPMDYIMPGFPVLHHLPEFAHTHVHWVCDAIQPSHPLLPASPPAFHLSQHEGLFQIVSSSHQVPRVLEFQLQHQSFSEHSGLISFRIDWLDLLTVILKVRFPLTFPF